MSVIAQKGFHLTISETDIICPICTFEFDASEKMDAAKEIMFKMKCPGCKSWLGVIIPVFGGTTKCFEWDPPKTIEDHQLKTVSPFRVNGKIVTKKLYDDNSDEEEETLILK